MSRPTLRLVGFLLAALGLATACEPLGTDGINLIDGVPMEASGEPAFAGLVVPVTLPHIPAVRLPDLSVVNSHDAVVGERLVALDIRPIDGVEVVEGVCQDRVTTGDQSHDVFDDQNLGYLENFSFYFDEDGTGTYLRESPAKKTRITTFGDGSGEFVDVTPTGHLSIKVEPDGAGEYFHENIRNFTSIQVGADGSGEFVRQEPEDVLTVTLFDDGSGELYAESRETTTSPTELTTIAANPDGSGEFYYELTDHVVTLRVRPDHSWEFLDRRFGESISVIVRADGSGQYRRRGDTAVLIDFNADGSNALEPSGPSVDLPATPLFVVADRFPTLGSLAPLEAPCAKTPTIIRFDSALLFEVNESTVLPAAAELLAEVAPALIDAGRSIEVNGHTDATGSESYNQGLSERRAEAVAAELRSLGVNVDITVQGFGELQPVADNYRPDGSDDLAGQRENRRVELVINE